ncbi:MAG: cytochrome c [Actinomycetota bacterium]|nr:cytochrome c [Actinomycetota bacterium]
MTEKLNEPAGVLSSTRRWQQAGLWVFLVLVLSFPIYKATEGTRRADALAAQQSAQVDAGAQLWGLNCATCHGPRGQGVSAPALNSQQFLGSVTDQQIKGIVAGGIPGSEMPAWLDEYGGPLTQQQIAALVAYIRSWEPNAPSVPDWRTPSGSG